MHIRNGDCVAYNTLHCGPLLHVQDTSSQFLRAAWLIAYYVSSLVIKSDGVTVTVNCLLFYSHHHGNTLYCLYN